MTSYSREEQTNWYRVCRLLTEGGKMILMDFLKQSIGSYTLDSYLASKRNDVNKVKHLHQPQKDILYPPGGGNTDPRQWDIALTACIINELIKPADPLQNSSIYDIRQLRNEILGHCGELRMNQSEFQTNWSRIKQVLSQASVVLLHNAGSVSLTYLEEDIENDEVTNFAPIQIEHILDSCLECDIKGVNVAIERQIGGDSQLCFIESEYAEFKLDQERLNTTIAREDRACSEIKDSSCPILEGQGPASMQSQSTNDQGATAENIPLVELINDEDLKTQMVESKSSNKQTIFGKPFEYSCLIDGEDNTFQIPGSDVKVIFPNSLPKNYSIQVHGSSFRSIFDIRKRFDLPAYEALASPVTEYHVTKSIIFSDYACVKMPFVGPRSELKVWKFPSDDDITNTTTRIQVPLKGRNSNEYLPDMFYEVEGSSTCLVYTRSFSCFYCTTDGRRPLNLRAFSYASHKRFQSTSSRPQHEVRIRMYIADEVMTFQDYKQRIDDIENMQDRCQAEDKGLSLPEVLTEDCIIEAYVTPTDDIDTQWVHKPNPNSNEPIFPEKQTHSLRDIVRQCPNSLRCHLQRDEIPYCLEWYLTNRQVDTPPSLSFHGFLNVDCVDNQQKGSTILAIEKLKMRQEVDVPAEESLGYYRPTGDSGGLFQAMVNILRTLANAVFWTRPRIAGNTSIWAGIESGEERQVGWLFQALVNILRRFANAVFWKRPINRSVFAGKKSISAGITSGVERPIVTEGAEMKTSYDCTLTQFLLSALNVHMPSVGALVSDRGQGTVFRVGSKYVMTAEHVVNDIIDPGKSGRVNVDLLKEDDVYITFSASLYQRGTIVFKIKEITYQYEDLDVAILEIENWETSTFPRELVLCKCPLSSRVKEISLIGFGHPEDKSKKNVDPKCKIKYIDDVHTAIVYLNENIQMYKDMVRRYQGNCPDIVSSVDQLYNDFDNPDKLLWSCYMENGGSGSPVINHNDHKSLKVIALYTHAIPGFIDYLDPTAKPFYPCDKRFEMGPRMSSIFLDLQQKNGLLANELFPGDC